MVATDNFMHLSEHVVSIFLSYAFKNGYRKASFIKGPPMNGESSRPCPKLGGLFWVAWQYSVHQVIQWGPSSLAQTLPGTLLHCRRSPRVLGGARPVPGNLDPPVMLLLALSGHLLTCSLLLGHA